MEFGEFRKILYREIHKLPKHHHAIHPYACLPEKEDFEQIKNNVISKIAYNIWETSSKPTNRDMEIWLKAERMWEFIRYRW